MRNELECTGYVENMVLGGVNGALLGFQVLSAEMAAGAMLIGSMHGLLYTKALNVFQAKKI